MSGDQGAAEPAFESGLEKYNREHGGGAAPLAVAPASSEARVDLPRSAAIVRPQLSLEQAKELWTRHLDLRDVILGDADCYDTIGGKREMNRTGATRLATVFGLSIEIRSIEEGRVQNADDNQFDYRYRVTVRVLAGGRYVDGISSCRISEIPEDVGELSRREHFALTRASTRATKRAIADILGGTEA